MASTTVGGLARRFTARVAGSEAGNTKIMAREWARLPERRRGAVLAGRASINLDATSVTRVALAQLPGHRAGRRPGPRVLVRTDGAGSTHAFLDWLTT